jgi:hypothetical protein
LTGFTYAQISCCGAQTPSLPPKTPAAPPCCAKLLISLQLMGCFFSKQFKQGLDFQGFLARRTKLSTKLSTKTLDRSGSFVKSTTYIDFRQCN